jgi:uncharacterized pyridoxal phosphate-containing UPF0001 family protein
MSIDRKNRRSLVEGPTRIATSSSGVCLQVNVSGEDSKSGVAPEEAADLAAHVIELPRLRELRGDGPFRAHESHRAAAEPFRMLKDVCDQLKQTGYDLDTVSMGMSAIWIWQSKKAQRWCAWAPLFSTETLPHPGRAGGAGRQRRYEAAQ